MNDKNEVAEITSQIARLLGKRGGTKVKERGKEYMATIGRRGGLKTRRLGIEYFAELGRRSAAKRVGKTKAAK